MFPDLLRGHRRTTFHAFAFRTIRPDSIKDLLVLFRQSKPLVAGAFQPAGT